MFFALGELLFPLFLLPSVFLDTEQVDYLGDVFRLLGPAPREGKAFHVLRHDPDVKRLEEVLVDIILDVAARNEDLMAVLVLDPRVPRNFRAPAPVLMLVDAFLPCPEGYG